MKIKSLIPLICYFSGFAYVATLLYVGIVITNHDLAWLFES